jgi:uncharacterized membrane protein
MPQLEFPSSIPSGIALSATSIAAYSGPVPPPEMLAEFDKIDPGRAGKLMQLAEDQSRHRMGLESYVVRSDVRRSWGGLIVGGLLSVTLIACGTYLVSTGHDWAGVTIITTTLVALAGVFVYGRSSQSKERQQKARRNP